ncbi:ecotin, partial [Escherichia coli]|nr:ecotin [Escherichia coli]
MGTWHSGLICRRRSRAGALAADQPLEKVAPFPKAEKGMKRQ